MSPIRQLQRYGIKRGTPAGNQDASIDNINKHTNHMNTIDTPTTPHYSTTPSKVNDNASEIIDASIDASSKARALPSLGLFASQEPSVAQVYNTSFATEPTIITFENERDLFRYDHTTISFNDGRCHGDNFAYATAIPFDIDNSHSDNPDDWVSPEKMQERLGQLGIIYWMAASRNHLLTKDGKAARPKFHVYLPLARPLHDSSKFVHYCEWCIKTFNADTQLKSKAQKMFGFGDNPEAFIYLAKSGRCIDEVLTDDDLLPTAEKPTANVTQTLSVLPVDTADAECRAIASGIFAM